MPALVEKRKNLIILKISAFLLLIAITSQNICVLYNFVLYVSNKMLITAARFDIIQIIEKKE